MTKNQAPAYTFPECKALAANCLGAATLADAIAILRTEAERIASRITRTNNRTKSGKVPGADWVTYMQRLADGLEAGQPAFSIFAKGNSKLPFHTYSELPGFSCPGAGECLKFCYSYKAWRFPVAFFRQLQNTLLMKFKKSLINAAFQALPPDTTLRLYNDGDFSSLQVLAYWFGRLASRTDVKAYGYSKSWELFRAYSGQGLAWPTNYVLNISSGGRYDNDNDIGFKAFMLSLPITRGEFLAVPVTGAHVRSFARYDDSAYHKAVRVAARVFAQIPKVFSCTGKCGDCLPNGVHACGSKTFSVVIANGVH